MARGSESVLVSTPVHTGTRAAWVTNRTATWQGVAQSLYGRVRPGGKYFCAAWVRAESATPQVLLLSFEQRDAAGTRYFNVGSATVTNNTWTFLSGTFSLDVAGALSDVIVYVEGPAAGVDVRVDDVAVVPLSGLRYAAAQGQRNLLAGGVGGSAINNEVPFGRVVGTDYHIAADNPMAEQGLELVAGGPGGGAQGFDLGRKAARPSGEIRRLLGPCLPCGPPLDPLWTC